MGLTAAFALLGTVIVGLVRFGAYVRAKQIEKELGAGSALGTGVGSRRRFNAHTGILRYVNAGHCPPLLILGTAEVLRLEAGGPVLGVLPSARYEYGEVIVQAGDLLVIFSDGIIEAADAQLQEFGEKRLLSAIERNWRKPPVEICSSILANVHAFIGRQPPGDD